MRPETDQTQLPNRPAFRFRFRTALKVLSILLLSASVPAAVYVRVASKNSAPASNRSTADSKSITASSISKGEVTVHAVGREKPFMNLHDGHESSVVYRGNFAVALQDGSARARS